MTVHHSHSVSETLKIAAAFSRRLRPGHRVGLKGELGTGKTVFAKGVISALTQIPVDEIPSPSFTLVEEYFGKGPVYHVDLYRLNSPEEVKELAWDEMLSPEAITLVEWPERLPERFRTCHFEISLSKEKETFRSIVLSSPIG